MITRENPMYGMTEDGLRYVMSRGCYCEWCDCLIGELDEDRNLYRTTGICRDCQSNRLAAVAAMRKALDLCDDLKGRIKLIHAIRVIEDKSYEERLYIGQIVASLQEDALRRSISQQAESRR